jgi:uncharacterized protein (DUF1015 family)
MVQLKSFKPLKAPPELIKEFSLVAYSKPGEQAINTAQIDTDCSYLQILNPAAFDPNIDQKAERYRNSLKNLNNCLNNGIIERSSRDAIYIYRQIKDGREYNGWVGLTSIADYEKGSISRHETTRPAKETAIKEYFQNVGVNGSPVLLTYQADEALAEIMDQIKQSQPLYDFTSNEGVQHTVWEITDQQMLETIKNSFNAISRIYIADGHHRFAAAYNYFKESQNDNPEAFNFMSYLIPSNELKIFAFHRLIKNLQGLSVDQFLNRASKNFLIEKAREPLFPNNEGEIIFYANGTWARLYAKPQYVPIKKLSTRLDVSILEQYILQSVLGIEDTLASDHIDFIEGTVPVHEIKDRLLDKGWQAAFLLHPIPINYLMRLSDKGETLPAKSTWIEPKPRSGVLIQAL